MLSCRENSSYTQDVDDGDFLVAPGWSCPLKASWFLGHQYQLNQGRPWNSTAPFIVLIIPLTVAFEGSFTEKGANLNPSVI